MKKIIKKIKQLFEKKEKEIIFRGNETHYEEDKTVIKKDGTIVTYFRPLSR